MGVLVVALIILGIFSAIFGLLSHNKSGENSVILADASSCATCDGTRQKCEQECMMEAATRPIEYFDDEELDRFRGREGNAYTDEEAEAFREVLYTMRESEAQEWSRSLTLRGITPPDQIRDELLMMVSGD